MCVANKKRILLVGIDFYDYEQAIICALEKYGYEVLYVSTYINTIQIRILERIRLNSISKKYKEKTITKYISLLPTSIDYIIIIKGDNLCKEHIELLKTKYPHVPVVLYLWDSLNRIANAKLLLKMFPKILTFDRKDAEIHRLVHRPLFFRSRIEKRDNHIKYGISFLGADHSTRYTILSKLAPILKKQGISFKFVLITGRLKFFLNRYVFHTIKKGDEYLFQTKRLQYQDYIDITEQSNVILDISHPLQSGLTMRSIEALCMGKKLLTTNNDICFYDFPHSLFEILDIQNYNISEEFYKNTAIESFNTYDYSLDGFIRDILNQLEINGKSLLDRK